jgi:hypothetical protein
MTASSYVLVCSSDLSRQVLPREIRRRPVPVLFDFQALPDSQQVSGLHLEVRLVVEERVAQITVVQEFSQRIPVDFSLLARSGVDALQLGCEG